MKTNTFFLSLLFIWLLFGCHHQDYILNNEMDDSDVILARSGQATLSYSPDDLVGIKLEPVEIGDNYVAEIGNGNLIVYIDNYGVFPELGESLGNAVLCLYSDRYGGEFHFSDFTCGQGMTLPYHINKEIIETISNEIIIDICLDIFFKCTTYDKVYYIHELIYISGNVLVDASHTKKNASLKIRRTTRNVATELQTPTPPEIGETILLDRYQYQERGVASSIWYSSKQEYHYLLNLDNYIVFPEYELIGKGAVLELSLKGREDSVFDFKCVAGSNLSRTPKIMSQKVSKKIGNAYDYDVDITLRLNYYYRLGNVKYLVGETVRITGTCVLGVNLQGYYDFTIDRSERMYQIVE